LSPYVPFHRSQEAKSLRVARTASQAGGETLAIGSKTLHKRLKEKKLLASNDKKRKRLQVRRTLEGRQREVLHLRADVLWNEKSSH
jgi:hypothetical protein